MCVDGYSEVQVNIFPTQFQIAFLIHKTMSVTGDMVSDLNLAAIFARGSRHYDDVEILT